MPPNDYALGPDSLPQAGVPAGKSFDFLMDDSKIFPGSSRKITVYVPAQYKADKPACVFVGMGGLNFEVPVVFDNLIHEKRNARYDRHRRSSGRSGFDAAVGRSAGKAAAGASRDSRPPRCRKIRGSTAAWSSTGSTIRWPEWCWKRFCPPWKSKRRPTACPSCCRKTPTTAARGASTNAIASFNLAWERPDAFRRVFTAIGTFVCMRGGDRLPVLVRKTEPKPIRIFMQDGENDEWMGGPEVGDWWMSNQTLERALEFSGYQVQHVWGHGTHSPQHATAIFPTSCVGCGRIGPSRSRRAKVRTSSCKRCWFPARVGKWPAPRNRRR